MKSIDVAVIGLGVYGSAVARAMARHGWRVLGLEESRADEVTAASAGPLRMVRTDHPGYPRLSELASASIENWKTLSTFNRAPIFQPTPGVFAESSQDRQASVGTQSCAERELASDDPLLAAIALPPKWRVLRPEGCGVLDARPSVLALREEARAYGAELMFGRRIAVPEALPAAGSPVRLHVGRESVRAERLLLCVGSRSVGLPQWARIPGLRVEPAYTQVASFAEASVVVGREVFYVMARGDDRFCVLPLPKRNRLQFWHLEQPAEI